MKRIAIVLACALLPIPALADGDLTDGREILKKADEAVKKIKLVEYRADYQGTAWVQQFVPAVTGTVVLGKQSKWEIPQFRCEIKLQKYGSEEVQELTAGCDGDVYFLIDPKTKTAHEDMDEAVLGTQSRDIQRALMREFSIPKPFGAILEPEEGDPPAIELKGTAKVGDQECYEVVIKPTGPQAPELHWFISKKDLLPRKIVRIYDREGEKGTTELAVHDLKVDPKLDRNPFKLVPPPGFKKTDEFAP